MKPENDRCEEHGLYLYRTGFGWSCKLGCYYSDDPQKIKDGFIAQYKEELKLNIKDTINIIENSINPTNSEFKRMLRLSRLEAYEEVLKLLE